MDKKPHQSSGYYGNTREEVAELLPENYSRVLEVGCGEGLFRANFTNTCEYWGIEPFSPAASTAETVLDKVLLGTYSDVSEQLPDAYFNVVVCNDVIEHMHDHDAFLDNIKSKLAPDGVIVGSVPNVRFISNVCDMLLSKDWEYKNGGILDRTHLRFFTEKSLRRTIAQHGYVAELFKGINKRTTKPTSLSKLFRLFLQVSFGKDMQYRQFAFRIKSKS